MGADLVTDLLCLTYYAGPFNHQPVTDCQQEIRDTYLRLDRAIGQPHEQAIVSMFYYDNMSLADIAYVTGSITSTVGSQLSRIRKKLYRIIKTL